MGAEDVSARWTKAAPGPCEKEDQVYALKLAEMAADEISAERCSAARKTLEAVKEAV